MTIKSLTTQISTQAMTVSADGYALTISPASSATGITLNAVAALTFNPNLVLGAARPGTTTAATPSPSTAT